MNPEVYTQDMRANHELCPYCGMWHTSMSCAPQFAGQSMRIVEQESEIISLRSELERVREENANYRTVLEKLREEIQDKARESNYHTDKCASFSRTECVCGVDTMSDFCDDLLSIEALLHPTAPKEG